ncbi:hypothetical protein NP493_546g04004 [Ridgeia piscesae]|uniref:Uncharacterized protein n=1 Tax=Ridgeia piscesae TaxID=27915 RepID=A0AAD9NQ84_RIDPI|nr:hypothetical protein NP493_546g04004 [Ridgeia piscesae]
MGKQGKKGGADGHVATVTSVARGRGLEVVSKENFLLRREGMAEVSSCCDCQRRRTMSDSSSADMSRKCRRRRAHSRLHSPVIMRLGDTINVSVKNKLKNSDDSDASSDDGSYSSSDSNISYHSAALTSYVYGQPHGYYYHSPDDSKNLNAFLSAIEKVHQKDTSDLSSTLNNLDENVPCCKKSARMSSPPSTLARTAMLNNLLHYHSHATVVGGSTCKGSSGYHKHGGFAPFDCDNVEVICNDLHSGGITNGDGLNVNCDDFECLENSSVVSSSESSSEYDAASRCDYDELSHEELDRLADYATGYGLTQYNCMSPQCPACIASQTATNFTYQLWMPEYYAQENDLLKIDVVGANEYDYDNYEDDDAYSNGSDSECCSVVVSKGPGKVEVSVGDLSKDNDRCNYRWRHRVATGSSWQATTFATLNTVSIDLTDSEVTFSVHYPPHDSPAATYQTTSVASYSPTSPYANGDYSTYASYPTYDMMAPSLSTSQSPYGGFAPSPFAPPGYYMYPVVSIPAPLCVPRDLKCLASQCLCMVPAHEIRNCKHHHFLILL